MSSRAPVSACRRTSWCPGPRPPPMSRQAMPAQQLFRVQAVRHGAVAHPAAGLRAHRQFRPGRLPGRRDAEHRQRDRRAAAKTAAENRDVCLGIKVRMTLEVVGNNGLEPLKRSVQAAEMAGPWAKVMCHIGNAPGNYRGGAGPAAPRRHPDACLLRRRQQHGAERPRRAGGAAGRSSAAW